MQVQINKPVTIGGTTYGKGQHTIQPHERNGWFFEALVKEGTIVILREDEAPVEAPVEAKTTRKSRKSTEASTDESATAEGE